MWARNRHELYRSDHARDALLGAFSFADENSVSVFVNPHGGDSFDVNRSVEHEMAHRSLALDSDTGAVQLALARAMADRPDEAIWMSWLAASIESSWSTYEGFAIEREAWIAAVHGRNLPLPAQSRYLDAVIQYELIFAALPTDLRPWRFILSRAVADFALNFSLADVTARAMFTPDGMRALLGDQRRRADARLARLSTSVERIGFDEVTLDRAREAIARTFDEFGSFALDPVQAHFEPHVVVGDDERRRHVDELDKAMMPVFHDYFQRICSTLPFDQTGNDRARFLEEVRTDLAIPVKRIVDVSKAAWPYIADVHSVQYIHEGRFDHELAFRESDVPDELFRHMADDPEVVAYAAWASGSTLCLLPFVAGPNHSQAYDPLRAPSAARKRGDEDDRVIRFSGERLFITEATPRTLAAFAPKMLGALYSDGESRGIVCSDEWLSGHAVQRATYSDVVLLLRAIRDDGCTKLQIVLRTPEIHFIVVRDRTGAPMLIELATALIGIIRSYDVDLFSWYSDASFNATKSADDLSTWGYIFASVILAGGLEPTRRTAEQESAISTK